MIHPRDRLSRNPKQTLLPGMYVRAIVPEEDEIQKYDPSPRQSGVCNDAKGNPIALIVDGSDRVRQKDCSADRSGADQRPDRSYLPALPPGDQVIVEGVPEG